MNQNDQVSAVQQQETVSSSAMMQEFVPYNLPPYAREWCVPTTLPRLDYHRCRDKEYLSALRVSGGMTNAIKYLLLGVIRAYEDDRCFYVDESRWHLQRRNNNANSLDSFINRYFEPIGLDQNDPFVQDRYAQSRVQSRGDFRVLWEDLYNRRMWNNLYNISSLHYENMQGHTLKKVVLRRMWRMRPEVRHDTCSALENHGLQDEYMAFSVRRGDKSTEGFDFTPTERYIAAAERAVALGHFRTVPKIFVATDDCTVLHEFRSQRPQWTFVSECDRLVSSNSSSNQQGFVLKDMLDWTPEETDAHFHKFFVELYAAAISKVFIGERQRNR